MSIVSLPNMPVFCDIFLTNKSKSESRDGPRNFGSPTSNPVADVQAYFRGRRFLLASYNSWSCYTPLLLSLPNTAPSSVAKDLSQVSDRCPEREALEAPVRTSRHLSFKEAKTGPGAGLGRE